MSVGSRNLPVAVLLAVTVLTMQLGALGQEHYNSDEFTFMILASDILDGQMPYIERFDNKPPGIFLMLAGAMALFGETLWTVRLFGDAALWLTSFMVYVIAAPRFGTGPAFAGAMVTVAIHGVAPGLFTSAGLPAMAAVMMSFWLLVRHPNSLWTLALAGVMISVATLTRTNLAYVAIAIGIYLTVGSLFFRHAENRLSRWGVVSYSLGGLLPLVAIVAVYVAIGAFAEFRLATVDVALSYSSGWGALGAAKTNLIRWSQHAVDKPLTYGVFTLLAAFALLMQVCRRPDVPKDFVHYRLVFWFFTISISFSILKSGAVYAYYWQQLFPLAGLLLAEALWRCASLRFWSVVGMGLSAVLTTSALAASVPETWRVIARPGYIDDRYTIRAVTDQLSNVLRPEDRVWGLERHLAIWYLDVPTVSRVVAHPSNIYRKAIMTPLTQAGYVPENELDRLYASRPEYLVTNREGYVFYVDLFGKDHERLDAYLAENYDRFIEGDHPDIEYDDITIWRRRDLDVGEQ